MLVVHVASLFGNTYPFERTIAVLGPARSFSAHDIRMESLNAGLQAERPLAFGTARLSTMDVSGSVGHGAIHVFDKAVIRQPSLLIQISRDAVPPSDRFSRHE